MATNTFGTSINPAHYTEQPDLADPGQVERPDAGATLLVKDATTLADLVSITTDDYGYWSATYDDVDRILVSGDGGVTWVGPLISREAMDALLDAGPGGGGTGVSSHPDLTNRDAADGHPIGAITGLQAALDAKQATGQAVLLTGAQTVAGIKTFSSPPVVPTNALPISAVNGLQAALDSPHSLTQSPPGDMIAVVKAVAQSWGTVSHVAGSWPTARPTSRTDVLVVWIGDTDPGAIAAAYDRREITP